MGRLRERMPKATIRCGCIQSDGLLFTCKRHTVMNGRWVTKSGKTPKRGIRARGT